jgi:hypothetical protein
MRIPSLFLTSSVLLALFTPLYADSITTSCTATTNSGTVTAPTSCVSPLVQGLHESTFASASASYSEVANSLVVEAQVGVSATPASLDPRFTNTASANVSISINVFVPGAGAGFMRAPPAFASSSTNIAPGDDYASLFITFGPANQSCINGQSCGGSYGLLPITLGTTLVFTEVLQADAGTEEDHGGGGASTNATFLFFGADGVTPVSIDPDPTVAPEPNSWGLLAVSLASVAAARFKS